MTPEDQVDALAALQLAADADEIQHAIAAQDAETVMRIADKYGLPIDDGPHPAVTLARRALAARRAALPSQEDSAPREACPDCGGVGLPDYDGCPICGKRMPE